MPGLPKRDHTTGIKLQLWKDDVLHRRGRPGRRRPAVTIVKAEQRCPVADRDRLCSQRDVAGVIDGYARSIGASCRDCDTGAHDDARTSDRDIAAIGEDIAAERVVAGFGHFERRLRAGIKAGVGDDVALVETYPEGPYRSRRSNRERLCVGGEQLCRIIPEETVGCRFGNGQRRTDLGKRDLVVECRTAERDLIGYRRVQRKRLLHAGKRHRSNVGIDPAGRYGAGSRGIGQDHREIAKIGRIFDGKPVVAIRATIDDSRQATAGPHDESVLRAGCTT